MCSEISQTLSYDNNVSKEVYQRTHGEGHCKKTWDGFICCGTRQGGFRPISGEKLLQYELYSTGGTKSKSKSKSK